MLDKHGGAVRLVVDVRTINPGLKHQHVHQDPAIASELYLKYEIIFEV